MSISASASPPALALCRQVEDPVITARALTKVYGRGAGAVGRKDARMSGGAEPPATPRTAS